LGKFSLLLNIIWANVTLFLPDESPNLIELQLSAGETAHFLIQYPRTALAHAHTEPHYRVSVDARSSLDCPNARAFRQCADYCYLLVDAQDVCHIRSPYSN
jgi:hypothetical protein